MLITTVGRPQGDLIFFNLLLGVTLIGLLFTIGVVVRALWLRFRITSRRISVSGGWIKQGQDAGCLFPDQGSAYGSTGVRRLGRIWCLSSTDGARLELRSMPRFREVEAYILDRINARSATPSDKPVEGFAA